MRSTSGACPTTSAPTSSWPPPTASSGSPGGPAGTTDARFDWLDDRASERPEWIAAYLEMKTVWHPIGV